MTIQMKERVPVQEAVASLEQCSMVVDTVQETEYNRVTVPGVILAGDARPGYG